MREVWRERKREKGRNCWRKRRKIKSKKKFIRKRREEKEGSEFICVKRIKLREIASDKGKMRERE